jgi:hypothetical protein
MKSYPTEKCPFLTRKEKKQYERVCKQCNNVCMYENNSDSANELWINNVRKVHARKLLSNRADRFSVTKIQQHFTEMFVAELLSLTTFYVGGVVGRSDDTASGLAVIFSHAATLCLDTSKM